MPQSLLHAFYTLVLAACLLTAAGLSGRESIGGDVNADTPLEAVLEAKASAKAYALLVEDLFDRGVITRSQARAQLEHLRTVQAELERVTDAIAVAGESPPPGTGETLARVDRALSLVLAFLATTEQTP